MDGVVADFNAQINRIFPEVSQITDAEERETAVDNLCSTHRNIFRNLPTIPDAVFCIDRLFKFYDIYFLSTPMWSLPESFSDKRWWLEETFGSKIAYKRLILTHRKDLCIGDYLIDDRLKNGAKDFKGDFIHFGSAKYPNWLFVTDYLLNKL